MKRNHIGPESNDEKLHNVSIGHKKTWKKKIQFMGAAIMCQLFLGRLQRHIKCSNANKDSIINLLNRHHKVSKQDSLMCCKEGDLTACEVRMKL